MTHVIIDDDNKIAPSCGRSDARMFTTPCPPVLGDCTGTRGNNPQSTRTHYIDGVVVILALISLPAETSSKGNFRWMIWMGVLDANDPRSNLMSVVLDREYP
jgi:hypothetical protein